MGSGSSRRNPLALSEKEIQLLLHKTDLNREQILEWHKDFIVKNKKNKSIHQNSIFSINKNSIFIFYKTEHPDGRIDIEEFSRLYKGAIQPNDKSHRFSQALFGLFDEEKSGRVTLSDFLVLTPFEIKQDTRKQRNLSLSSTSSSSEDEAQFDPECHYAVAQRQQKINDIDERTLQLAMDVFNRRSDRIDKEELFKVPFVLCEASGADARAIFETDNEFANKKKFFEFDNDKLSKDEFTRLVRGCRRFIV